MLPEKLKGKATEHKQSGKQFKYTQIYWHGFREKESEERKKKTALNRTNRSWNTNSRDKDMHRQADNQIKDKPTNQPIKKQTNKQRLPEGNPESSSNKTNKTKQKQEQGQRNPVWG